MEDHTNPPAVLLNNAGLPWTIGRLREACKLNLSVSWLSDRRDDQSYLGSSVVKAALQACEGLTSLETLVRFIVLQPRFAYRFTRRGSLTSIPFAILRLHVARSATCSSKT